MAMRRFLFCSFSFLSLNLLAHGFEAGTLVKVPDGHVAIETLVPGSVVMSCDVGLRCVPARVIAVGMNKVSEHLEVTTDSDTIRTSAEQKFKVAGEWVEASALKRFAQITDSQRGSVSIVKTKLIKHPLNLYWLTVEEHHNFYVSGADLLAHNVLGLFALIPVAPLIGQTIFTAVIGTVAIGAFTQGPFQSSSSQGYNQYSGQHSSYFPHEAEARFYQEQMRQKELADTLLHETSRLRAQAERQQNWKQTEQADVVRELLSLSNSIRAESNALANRFQDRATKLHAYATHNARLWDSSPSKVPQIVVDEFKLTGISPTTFEGSEIILVANHIAANPKIFDDEVMRFQAATSLHQAKNLAAKGDLRGTLRQIDSAWAVVDYARGINHGLQDFAIDSMEGMARLFAHPLDSASAIYDAVANYDKTYDAIHKAMETVWYEYDSYTHQEKGKLHAKIAAEILSMAVPIGGVKNLAKVAKLQRAATLVVEGAAGSAQKIAKETARNAPNIFSRGWSWATGATKVKYVSRGSTADLTKGTTIPRNLREKLAVEEARANPAIGKELGLEMTDPRWPKSEGWVKRHHQTQSGGNQIVVHYVHNKRTNFADDFKIKINSKLP
jgi:hypothetical protein